MKTTQIVNLMLYIGLLLLVVNITGLFIPLRNDAIYTEPDASFPRDIVIPYKAAVHLVNRLPGEADLEYLERLTQVINASMAHYWVKEDAAKYRILVPVWENWLLWIAGMFRADGYDMYEYFDYHKALERGVGMCSQHAIAEVGILNDNGVEAQIINLSNQHIVLRARIGDEYYVADPDFGVVIPYDLWKLHQEPELVRPYYQGFQMDDWAIKVFALNGHVVFDDLRMYKQIRLWSFTEWFSYLAIWLIPLLLIVPFLLHRLDTKRRAAAFE